MPKPIIPVDHAINWYIGNYLMNQNNALREDDALWREAYAKMEILRSELKGQRMTHKAFLEMVVQKGIHGKYYSHKTPPENDCELCRRMRIK